MIPNGCKTCGHSADEHDFTAMIDEETGDIVVEDGEYITYDQVDTPCNHPFCNCWNYAE